MSENRELSQFMDKRNSLIKVHNFYQNSVVQPLLTDLYQITMAYAYWKSGKTDDRTVFDLFFRNNPFQGEFTIFAGLEECLKFIENFHYSDGDIEYLKQTLPEGIEDEFFEYLRQLTARDAVLYALEEGSVVFPRVPLIKIEGPLIIVQLLETTLLTLVNFASLMATNAARYRMVAGKNIKLLEFGLRRAQGPDGGLSASKYSYIGGFDGTSNVLAGKLFNIPVKGTHAHAYITSFTGITELKLRSLRHKVTGLSRDILELAINHRELLSVLLDVSPEESSEGELAAMVSFAIAFPDGFMALVDTYDVKRYSAYRPNSLGFDNKLKIKQMNKNNNNLNNKLIEMTSHKSIKKPKLNNLNGFCNINNNKKNGIIFEDKKKYNNKMAKKIICDNKFEIKLDKKQIELNNKNNNINNCCKKNDLEKSVNDINLNGQNIKKQITIVKQIDMSSNVTAITTTKRNLQNGDNKFITATTTTTNTTIPITTATTTTTISTTLTINSYLPKFVGKSFRSGLLNFCAVALALNDQGYRAVGVRIDSGDLAYLSCLSRQTFERVAERFKIPWFSTLTIVASNDINEETILSLNEQGHKIDCFGIGTHLVTCQKQPALGCVYKMVEINGQARIKLSQDVEKVTMPGNKSAYRLFGADGHALIDLLQKVTEPPPEIGQKVLCRHPFQESKRAYVSPTRVESLYKIYWKEGHISQPLPTLDQIRERVQTSLRTVRQDHKRNLNPTPYKVAVSDQLYSFIHNLWLQNAPIGELS